MNRNNLCNKVALELFADISDCYNKTHIENNHNKKHLIRKCLINLDERYKVFKSLCVI